MSPLDTATEQLAEAHAVLSAAQLAAEQASHHARSLREQVTSGTGNVTAAELAAADDDAEHAALVATGANAVIPALSLAVANARSDDACNAVSETLPLLGSRLMFALSTVESALADFASAAQTYDAFADNARVTLDPVSRTSDRVKFPRYGLPTCDGRPISASHSERLLASVFVPTLQALKAPAFAVKEQKLLAEAAIAPPTS